MISVQAYRNAIGLYMDKAQYLSSKGKSKVGYNGKGLRTDGNIKCIVKVLSHLVNLNIILVIYCACVLIQDIILMNSGDIETNPGPCYSIEKVVQGSFHQGNRQLFGDTAGVQCACNSLYALCWTQIKQIFCWSRSDLDHILVEGDLLYKSLGTFDMLSADQLPQFVQMYNHEVPVHYARLETHLATLTNGDAFLRDVDVLTHQDSTTLCLLFMESFTTAIIKYRNFFYLFDSHSRDVRGLSIVDGTSVLMKFKYLHEIEKYIQVAYLEYRDRQQAYFQLQFIEVTVNSIDKIDIYSQYVRNVRLQHDRENSANINKRQQTYYSNMKGSPQHSKINQEKRENSKQTYNKLKGSSKFKCMMDKRRLNKRRLFEISFDENVKKFKTQVKNGPFFVCVVCNRCHYKKSVIYFKREKYSVDQNVFFMVMSYDQNFYICNTCDKSLRKNCIPCQAVSNKLNVVALPTHFQGIRRLERILVSRRVLFKKVTVMPKGKSLKMKGSVCNIPVNEVDVNCKSLPRPADSNGLLIVKLKRKLEYKGHVVFEAVRPALVLQFLEFLKNHNHLYSDIEINPDNISVDLLHSQVDALEENELFLKLVGCIDEPMEVNLEKVDEETQEDPLAEFRAPSIETTIISETPSACELEEQGIVVAPGEGKIPVSILNDTFCEELAHPHLFPTGQFGFQIKREVPLTPSKYFNQRLLHYSQTFAADSDFIFFAHAVLQKIQLSSQINIAMKKVVSDNLTAGMLSKNFKQTVKDFIAKDKAFSFMSSIKGTPAYWKKFLHQVLAMVKQLGTPTFFLTLSCADLRWNELISIICKLDGVDVADEDIKLMSYNERCETLNKNPVLVARHFQYRVEVFFKVIVLDGPLGKTQYYAIRVEFQVRGSPHIHSFIWILNSPKLSKSTIDEYKSWVDSIIRSDLPDPHSEPSLFELVKTYQIHRHSRTCRKYRNEKCRFHFGKFFTSQTIIAQPLEESIPTLLRNKKMQQRNAILKKVKNYIDNELNPSKKNFLDSSKDDYEELKSIDEILELLDISRQDYEEALSISDDNDFQIHYKREPNSCFVNNYFCHGLMAWEANMDIQPVFNHYKAVAYMCAYLSKSESECSLAMKQAVRDAFEKDLDNYEQMKSIAKVYVNKRECSIQECVYHILPGQWLRKTFPGVIFANSNVPEKRFRVCLGEEEISELPEDSKKIFKRNIVDRYIDRPNITSFGGKFAVLDAFCFAEFSRYYYLPSNPKYKENDYQPEELEDEVIEDITNVGYIYPKEINLLSKEKLKCRKIPFVLQFHVPNKEIRPEEYAHHLLFMYYPFRDEKDLLSGNPPTYACKLGEPGVMDVVNKNFSLIEPFANIVDTAFERFNSDMGTNMDSYGQQENDEVCDSKVDFSDDSDTDMIETQASQSADIGISNRLTNQERVIADEVINENIRSLNMLQREVFNFVHKWSRDYIKSLSSKIQKKVKSFYIFITGGAGVGKSHLIKTIHMSLSKVLQYKGGDPEKPRILLLAPTGVAAININGTTIHSGLGINVGGKLYPLSDSQRESLRNRLSEIRLIIIDEISMVSRVLLFQVNQRLNEIFKYSGQEPFAGLPVIVCGDFYQLPPVKGSPIYSSATTIKGFLALDLWQKFKMVELTEVMRQRGDLEFIQVLNKIRVGDVDEDVEHTLKSRFEEQNFPQHIVHMFAENKPVKNHNSIYLDKLDSQLILIDAIDEFPKNIDISESQIDAIKQRKISETGNLHSQLSLKIGAQVMLTTNIDIDDRLVNGLVGRVTQFKYSHDAVSVVYVKFNDASAGLLAMRSDATAQLQHWVPVKKREALFGLRKNKCQPSVKRTQFPLTLSWACTVHKVQGLSLTEGVVSFDLESQKSFNQGQMYVALSRISSINKLYLVGKYKKEAIKVNLAAKKEYERLRRESLFNMQPQYEVTESSITLSLLNTRSLQKHFMDIAMDRRLMANDLLCLTETQLRPSSDTSIVESALQYKMHFNNSENQFKSIAYGYASDIDVIAQEDFDGISIFTFKKEPFFSNPISVGLIYRCQHLQPVMFLDCVRYLVNREIDILLGDFNIDALDEMSYNRLKEVLCNYNLQVSEPTHLDGALLDQIYLRNSFEHNKIVRSMVNNIYFSDHDAVKLELKFRKIDEEDIDFNFNA